jgi:hypothetical protein
MLGFRKGPREAGGRGRYLGRSGSAATLPRASDARRARRATGIHRTLSVSYNNLLYVQMHHVV